MKDILTFTKKILVILTFFCLGLGCKNQPIELVQNSESKILNYQLKSDHYQEKERNIRIYLPPGYDFSKTKYPVIYMMDGQNLFYDSTSYVGEWHVDESINTLVKNGFSGCVIVGIDHGNERRLVEYNPYNHPKFGDGEGEKYVNWMVNKLIPEIENSFKIDKSKVKRGIGGSSMGGLIALHAIHQYPEIFGHAALFSVSFPIAPEALKLLSTLNKNSKIYLVTGEKEGDKMVDGLLAADSILNSRGFQENDYFTRIVPDGEHNEKLWDTAFVDYYKWISEKW